MSFSKRAERDRIGSGVRFMVRKRVRAFTLFELVVVVTIIAVLAVVLAEHLLTYQERAEKAAMEQTVVVLRSAMQLRAASLLVRDRLNDIKQLESDNPMNWLSDRPANYIGVFADPPPADISAGKWYFDGRQKLLVYVPQRTRYFVPGTDGQMAIRFRVRIDLGLLPGEEGRANPMRGLSNMQLTATEPYNWFRDLN
jgi:general secretion pathway protein G